MFGERVSTWLDVWIQFKTGPKGKTTKYYGPCIVTKSHLEKDIEIMEKIEKEDGEFETLDDCRKCLRKLEDKYLVVDDIQSGIPEIYVNEEFIDANKLKGILTQYLRKLGLTGTDFRFKFDKPKYKIYAT